MSLLFLLFRCLGTTETQKLAQGLATLSLPKFVGDSVKTILRC